MEKSMALSVSETAKLTGISVRTLHYYDEIGLLKPAYVSDAGYRYYDEKALEVLQQILLYRELDVPLKEIKEILSMPEENRKRALKAHRKLLLLQQQRMGRLVGLVDGMLKGEQTMDFQEFDMTEIEQVKEQYREEAKHRWGRGEAWKESEKRTSSYDKEKWKLINEEADGIMKAFSECRYSGEKPEGEKAQALVERWQAHITRWYYPCTTEILKGLGEMYVQDGRFRDNLDRFGEGTAAYISDSIRCKEGKTS